MTITILKPNSSFYEQLLGKVDERLLHLKDARGAFLLDRVHERNIIHFISGTVDKPWSNHMLLAILVYVDKNADVITIKNYLSGITPRLNDLFKAFHLKSMSEFDVELHMYKYLKASVYQEHTDSMRDNFLAWYCAVSYSTKKWLDSKLNIEQRTQLEQYQLTLPSYDSRDFTFTKSSMIQRQNTRKNETDAIVPLLPQIRAEGHFRWNQLNRLRQAFLKACEQANTTNCKLPLDFHYDEPERVGERFYFRLWDRVSFVLNHQEHFSERSLRDVFNRKSSYSDENNHFFVEFIKAEQSDCIEDVEGLWFLELFKQDVIGDWHQNASDEEIKQKREFLNSWGYGFEKSNPKPFQSGNKGIISQSTFVSFHKDKVEGILFDVEPLYAGVTFGLLAVDIFTTTGARINELLQLNNTRECIRTVKVENKLRFSFYAIPKGRDELEPFYLSEQTMKLIQLVGKFLKEHYGTDKLPSVNYRYQRKHLFPNPKPYFFQYNNKSLNEYAIRASIRFLLHGLNFETQEGKPVVVNTHLLRHAFATEAVQRQKMPIDIVAKILHQRDLAITGYYSEPTPSQISQSVSDLHDIISDYVDIDEAVLRRPEDLEKEIEEYKEKVGVFNNVIGGTCITDHVCPIKMQCLGCAAKIPQPEKKHELLEVIELSKDMEKRYNSLGLHVEVKKARAMMKHARNELKEIELIEKYIEEQEYEPHIQFDER